MRPYLLLSTAPLPRVMKAYRFAVEKVAEETKHLHDNVYLRVSEQTEQVVTAERTQDLRPQLLLTAECHVLQPTTTLYTLQTLNCQQGTLR